jgi:hypothetical protein
VWCGEARLAGARRLFGLLFYIILLCASALECAPGACLYPGMLRLERPEPSSTRGGLGCPSRAGACAPCGNCLHDNSTTHADKQDESDIKRWAKHGPREQMGGNHLMALRSCGAATDASAPVGWFSVECSSSCAYTFRDASVSFHTHPGARAWNPLTECFHHFYTEINGNV